MLLKILNVFMGINVKTKNKCREIEIMQEFHEIVQFRVLDLKQFM